MNYNLLSGQEIYPQLLFCYNNLKSYMSPTPKNKIKKLLKRYKVRVSKKFGQNFLINENVFKKITRAAELSTKDIVLEIGPGIGNLTQFLAKKAKQVIAVEKDKRMIKILKETLSCYKNVKIIQADILKVNINDLIFQKKYKIVSNPPYYITSPIIRKFLETKKQPELLVLMVQKEVAERICSQPPKMNLLSVSVQFYSNPEIVDFVSKKYFWPQPKVDSAILKIIPKSIKPPVNPDLFFKIVRAGFTHPRKQLVNNLSSVLELNKEKVKEWLRESKIKPIRRAETLSLKEWFWLTKNFKNIE